MKVMKPMMALASVGLLAATIAFSPVPVIPASNAAVETGEDAGPDASRTFDELAASRTIEDVRLERKRTVFLTPPPKPREVQVQAPRPVRMPASGGTAQLRRTTTTGYDDVDGGYEPYFRPFTTGSASKTGLSDFKRRRLARDRQMARYRENLQRSSRYRGR